jgi:hypothetical protein
MTLNCLSPFDGVDLRTATALVAAGVLIDDMHRFDVAPEVVDIVSTPGHADRMALPFGPMVGHVAKQNVPPSLEFPITFFMSDAPPIRESALKYFTHLRDTAPKTLSPRSGRLLSELGNNLLSTDRQVWTIAALALGDALDHDILLNIAGIAQCVAIKFPQGIPDFLEHVLRPSRDALEALQLQLASPTTQQTEIANVLADIGRSSASVTAACDAFFDRLGHLPLTAAYGLAEAMKSWKQYHPGSRIGEPLLTWAKQHSSPFARFHASVVFLTFPTEASTSQWPDIASLIIDVVRSFQPDSTDKTVSIPWQIRCDLAKHFLQYLEPMVPGQDERVAAVSWWLADKLAESFGTSDAFLSSVHTRTIQPEETRSAHLWLLCRPPAQPTLLRYATLNSLSPWGYALLASLNNDSAIALSTIDDTSHLKSIAAAYIHCLLYPSFSFPNEQQCVVCGDAKSICDAATALSRSTLGIEDTSDLEMLAALGLRLLQRNDVMKAVKAFDQHTPQQQIIFFGALRALIQSDSETEHDLWEVLQEADFRERLLCDAALVVVELLSDAVAFLAGTTDRWRAFGPHLYALAAMSATKQPERRQALFALTVLVSLAAGTTSAIRRIIQSKKRGCFREDIDYWRERISSAVPTAMPWAQGRLRAMLATMQMG